MNKSETAKTTDLYFHGANSICRNCAEHVNKHTSQFVNGSRAYVCPKEN